MKKTVKTAAMVLLITVTTANLFKASAQEEDKSKRPSPPAMAMAKVGNANISINYGQPSVKGREVWGKLVPYGEVWRTGANEATTFETDKDIKVQGKVLPAGKYGFFTVPGEKEWTIVFNKVPNQWGAFKYDQAQDYMRVTAKPKKSAKFNEKLLYSINKGWVSIDWENLDVSFKAE
ncbi:MAG: DUF2911 domain-containing protein [Bacteroidota bacterium]